MIPLQCLRTWLDQIAEYQQPVKYLTVTIHNKNNNNNNVGLAIQCGAMEDFERIPL